MAACGWRREAGQEDKVRDAQGKQRSRGGLSNGAVGIPYSRRGLDTDSVGDPGQAIPAVSLPLFLKGRHRVRHTSKSGMAHSLASFKPSPWAQPDLLTYNCNPPQCSQSAPHPPHPALPLFFLNGFFHFLSRYVIYFLVLFAVYRHGSLRLNSALHGPGSVSVLLTAVSLVSRDRTWHTACVQRTLVNDWVALGMWPRTSSFNPLSLSFPDGRERSRWLLLSAAGRTKGQVPSWRLAQQGHSRYDISWRKATFPVRLKMQFSLLGPKASPYSATGLVTIATSLLLEHLPPPLIWPQTLPLGLVWHLKRTKTALGSREALLLHQGDFWTQESRRPRKIRQIINLLALE